MVKWILILAVPAAGAQMEGLGISTDGTNIVLRVSPGQVDRKGPDGRWELVGVFWSKTNLVMRPEGAWCQFRIHPVRP